MSITLNKGDKITVVRWKTINCRSFIGEILEVLAVDDPLVVVRPICKNGSEAIFDDWTPCLNLTEVEWKFATQEFIDLLVNKVKKGENEKHTRRVNR